MGTLYGKDIRAKFRTAAGPPEVFTAIGGETGISWNRSSTEIDLSDKDSGAYGSTSYGQQKVTIKVSGNVKLPDIGLEAAFDTSKSQPPEGVLQIVRGSIVLFESAVGLGNFSIDGNKDGAATYSFDASNIGTPTVDDLGAS
jgi:predicted secreted protein